MNEIGSVYTTPRLCLPCGKEFLPQRRVDRRLIAEYCSDGCRLKATRGSATVSPPAAPIDLQSAIFDSFEERARQVARGRPLIKAAASRAPRPIAMPTFRPDTPVWARNIATERVRRGWSQQTLADHAGVHVNSIAVWERGERKPVITQFARIARALGIGLDDLWRAS